MYVMLFKRCYISGMAIYYIPQNDGRVFLGFNHVTRFLSQTNEIINLYILFDIMKV